MKKAIALLLTLLMVLSLAACGSQTDSVGKIDEDKQQTEQAEQPDNTQQNETGATEETQQPETSTQEESVIYTLDTVPKPAGRENPTEVTEDGYGYAWQNQTERQELDDYIALLSAEGFTVSEFSPHKSDDKIQVAQATRGNATVEFSLSQGEMFEKTYYDFYAFITVEEVEQPEAKSDVSEIGVSALPEGDWNIRQVQGKDRMYIIESEQAQRETVQDFVATLEAAGYTYFEQEEDGSFYIMYDPATGQNVNISFNEATGYCQIKTYY